jgi:vacuolar-type H+-ATPase subunit I/STV1
MSKPVYNMHGMGHLLELYGSGISKIDQEYTRSTPSEQLALRKHMQNTIDNAMHATSCAQQRLHSAKIRKSCNMHGGSPPPDSAKQIQLKQSLQELVSKEKFIQSEIKRVSREINQETISSVEIEKRKLKEIQDAKLAQQIQKLKDEKAEAQEKKKILQDEKIASSTAKKLENEAKMVIRNEAITKGFNDGLKKSSDSIKSVGSSIGNAFSLFGKNLKQSSQNLQTRIDDASLKRHSDAIEKIEYKRDVQNLPSILPRRDAVSP